MGWTVDMVMSNCSGSQPKRSHAAVQLPYSSAAAAVWPAHKTKAC